MDLSLNLSPRSRAQAADFYADLRLRRHIGKWDIGLLLQPEPGLARKAERPRTPSSGSRSSRVAHGYVVGSPAERAARALDLTPRYAASKPFGDVVYVDGPNPVKATSTPKVVPTTRAPRADGGGVVTLTDHDLMARLGIQPVGFLD